MRTTEYNLRYVPRADEGVAAGTAVLRSWHEQMHELLNAAREEDVTRRASMYIMVEVAVLAVPPRLHPKA